MKKKLSGRRNRVIGKVTAVLKRAGQSFRITGYPEMNENATFSSQLFVNAGENFENRPRWGDFTSFFEGTNRLIQCSVEY